MTSYKVFTVENGGKVSEGARVGDLHLKGAGIDIPAILIGEEGRGRDRGVLPIGNAPRTPCPNRHVEWKSGPDYHDWVNSTADPQDYNYPVCGQCGLKYEAVREDKKVTKLSHPADRGEVYGLVVAAEVGTTRAGKPKLFARGSADSSEKIIVVFRTNIGFRGGNSHTGDRTGWKCSKLGCDTTGQEIVLPEKCPKCGTEAGSWDGGPRFEMASFPGEILAKGVIAQGGAGRMGSGQQLVAIMPAEVVFRTGYSGRLYGAPAAHYYVYRERKLLSATWDERLASDVF